jgi:hypothetical protein
LLPLVEGTTEAEGRAEGLVREVLVRVAGYGSRVM